MGSLHLPRSPSSTTRSALSSSHLQLGRVRHPAHPLARAALVDGTGGLAPEPPLTPPAEGRLGRAGEVWSLCRGPESSLTPPDDGWALHTGLSQGAGGHLAGRPSPAPARCEFTCSKFQKSINVSASYRIVGKLILKLIGRRQKTQMAQTILAKSKDGG